MPSEIIKHLLISDFNEVCQLSNPKLESIVKNREEASRLSQISADFSHIFLGKFKIDSSNVENYMPNHTQYMIAKEILEGTFDYSLIE